MASFSQSYDNGAPTPSVIKMTSTTAALVRDSANSYYISFLSWSGSTMTASTPQMVFPHYWDRIPNFTLSNSGYQQSQIWNGVAGVSLDSSRVVLLWSNSMLGQAVAVVCQYSGGSWSFGIPLIFTASIGSTTGDVFFRSSSSSVHIYSGSSTFTDLSVSGLSLSVASTTNISHTGGNPTLYADNQYKDISNGFWGSGGFPYPSNARYVQRFSASGVGGTSVTSSDWTSSMTFTFASDTMGSGDVMALNPADSFSGHPISGHDTFEDVSVSGGSYTIKKEYLTDLTGGETSGYYYAMLMMGDSVAFLTAGSGYNGWFYWTCISFQQSGYWLYQLYSQSGQAGSIAAQYAGYKPISASNTSFITTGRPGNGLSSPQITAGNARVILVQIPQPTQAGWTVGGHGYRNQYGVNKV